jgi:phosphate transport system permease protein
MPARSVHNRLSAAVSLFMQGVCIAMTAFIVAVLLAITGYIAFKGVGGLSSAFFTNTPDQNPPGIANGIYGTSILLLLASTVGVPLGLLTGIYLSEYDQRSRLAAPLRFVCDLLAGVPSIVVGVLGYQLLVVRRGFGIFQTPGHDNGWAGALALAFIMVPIIARTTEEMLRLVPTSYREASIALGATKAGTILKVVLPSAAGSVATGVTLAIARVAGETAPLIFTAGVVSRMETNPSNPFPSITALIYLDFRNSPDPARQSLAWAGILVLIALIFALNMTIRFVTRSRNTLR